jgi:hypothetical protein
MSTLNGFGTMFYGWRHAEGTASTATKWLSVFYIPVVPLGRYELKVKTDFANEGTRLEATPVGLMASQSNHFEILRKTNFRWSEVLQTYANTFVGLPLLMCAPLLLLWLLSHLISFPHYKSTQDTPLLLNVVLMAVVALQLVSLLCWPIWAIRKLRGMQAGRKAATKVAGASIDRRSVEHHL